MVERLAAASEKRKLGDPFDAATEQGPQVDKTQFDKVLGYIESGKKQGARCVSGGERFGTKGYFIKPTIFADVKDEMTIATEEIFGPVMQVLKFNDVDEVVQRANTTDYGLAAAVWTRDIKKAHSIADRIRAGTVWINCYDVFDAAAPFGGFKAAASAASSARRRSTTTPSTRRSPSLWTDPTRVRRNPSAGVRGRFRISTAFLGASPSGLDPSHPRMVRRARIGWPGSKTAQPASPQECHRDHLPRGIAPVLLRHGQAIHSLVLLHSFKYSRLRP